MDDHTRSNMSLWNRLTEINSKSELYDLEGFKSGKTSLSKVEIEELGPFVKERTLLHLQCHFGMDTLSWARLGAIVTGVDFSEEAILLARSLAAEVGLESRARFVCSDIYDVRDVLGNESFDIVYTGGGALTWLRDLNLWGKIVGQILKTNGTFYIIEFHPFANVFDPDTKRRSYAFAFHTSIRENLPC